MPDLDLFERDPLQLFESFAGFDVVGEVGLGLLHVGQAEQDLGSDGGELGVQVDPAGPARGVPVEEDDDDLGVGELLHQV